MHAETLKTRPHSFAPSAVLLDLWSKIGAAWATHRTYRRRLAELQDLDARELDDLGIGPADFHDIARGVR